MIIPEIAEKVKNGMNPTKGISVTIFTVQIHRLHRPRKIYVFTDEDTNRRFVLVPRDGSDIPEVVEYDTSLQAEMEIAIGFDNNNGRFANIIDTTFKTYNRIAGGQLFDLIKEKVDFDSKNSKEELIDFLVDTDPDEFIKCMIISELTDNKINNSWAQFHFKDNSLINWYTGPADEIYKSVLEKWLNVFSDNTLLKDSVIDIIKVDPNDIEFLKEKVKTGTSTFVGIDKIYNMYATLNEESIQNMVEIVGYVKNIYTSYSNLLKVTIKEEKSSN